MSQTTRIVILGGGFGGLAVARELERRLPLRADVSVTLVNRDNYFLFTPMLHEVAASDLDVTTIVNPLRKLLRRTRLFVGTVERIDTAARTVTVSHADGGHAHALPYDHLVLALGAQTNFFRTPGVAEHALTMKTLGDAVRLRNQLIRHLEEADFECNADVRTPLLTYVVAGGGFAGVETVAAVNDFLREAVRYYPNVAPSDLRVLVVHAGPTLLPELGEALGRYTRKRLAERGVEVLTDTRVAAVDGDVVTLSDGRRVLARTVVWTAGNAANATLRDLPCATERGRIVVDACLRVPELPDVWALGDCAHVPDDATGGAFPPTAQHALREGRHAARNIVARLRGEAPTPFAFSTLGLLAAIGRRTGVAHVLGVNFSGFVAWWLWRTVYLAKLPRFEKKLRAAIEWTLDVLFSKDLVQFGTHVGDAMPRAQPGTISPRRAIHSPSTPTLPTLPTLPPLLALSPEGD